MLRPSLTTSASLWPARSSAPHSTASRTHSAATSCASTLRPPAQETRARPLGPTMTSPPPLQWYLLLDCILVVDPHLVPLLLRHLRGPVWAQAVPQQALGAPQPPGVRARRVPDGLPSPCCRVRSSRSSPATTGLLPGRQSVSVPPSTLARSVVTEDSPRPHDPSSRAAPLPRAQEQLDATGESYNAYASGQRQRAVMPWAADPRSYEMPRVRK